MNQNAERDIEKEIQEALHERSISLSRPAKKERADAVQYLLIRLGSEEYAIKIDAIVEIIKDIQVTPVPGAPDFIEGVTNLRGEMLSVVDLARAIGLSNTPVARNERRIIKVRTQGIDVGLLIDGISGIHEFGLDMIEPPLLTVEKTGVEHLEGEIKTEGKLIGILDLANTLRIQTNA